MLHVSEAASSLARATYYVVLLLPDYTTYTSIPPLPALRARIEYSCSSRRWSTGRPLELAGAPGGPAGSYEYAADLLAWSVA
jgi:hypothetical protein